MLAKISIFFLLFSFSLFSIEYSPWTERDFELLPSLEFQYQNYSKVDSGKKSKKIDADDYFLTGGISTSYAEWSAEIEAVFADTYNRSFGFDSITFTGRYRWLSDIMADFATLTTGLSLIYSSNKALNDFSSFHHGRYEAEGHVSIGKEISCRSYWLWRFWSVFAFGIAERGSPWIRGQIAVDKNISCSWYFRAFASSLFGLGDRDISIKSFHGYGSIKHRSIELGTKIYKPTDEYGTFRLGYSYRFYARNFPINAHLILAEYLYPFGL